ncbi:MAG: peptidoglycan bridge formation glycyltransferase FemA/FemB family protein [Candidatus Pacebacteria bacterium]|nr:peptidoglycan bridge formation glycyltransferase FemA/FemB family protein [Candidatus Paceibacterota bacterium]
MIIREALEKDKWEESFLICKEKTFCQSWNWGEFNKAMGDKVFRFEIYDGEELVALCQVLRVKARRGTFIFVPHGPAILRNDKKYEIVSFLLNYLKELGKKEKAAFIRFSPIMERTDGNICIWKKLGFKDAPIHMHPELTWELDIRKDEEDILREMRKTTRYLVRQAEKIEGVEISKSSDEKDLEGFEKVYEETAERHSFTPFSKKYLEKELDAFREDNQVVVLSGKYNGEVVSSAMIIFWSEIGFYHQGASSFKYSKVPVSYLLQWEAIKEAKKRGCKFYNFWGIAPEEDKNHPWAGLSLFKKGFGGYKKEYVKTQDYVLSPMYYLIYIFEQLRKRKRNL